MFDKNKIYKILEDMKKSSIIPSKKEKVFDEKKEFRKINILIIILGILWILNIIVSSINLQ